MAQFADLKPAVKKAAEAECTIRGGCDRSTGERGVVLSVSSINWSFGDRVEVEGGFSLWSTLQGRRVRGNEE